MLSAFTAQLFNTSFYMAVVIGLLLLFFPLYKKRYRNSWRCVVWLVIGLRLLFPADIDIPPLFSIEVPYPAPVMITGAEAFYINAPGASYALSAVAGWVWLAGALIYALFHIGAYLHFLRKINAVRRETLPYHLEKAAYRVRRDMGFRKLPEIIVTQMTKTPVLTGFIKPRILLPHSNYSEEAFVFILRHELTHLRRRDMAVRLVLLAANALHWFNPLVYLMNRRAEKDIELACDDAVIRHFDNETRSKYGSALLMAAQTGKRAQPFCAVYLGGSKQNLKTRIANLFDHSKKRRGVWALLVTGFVAFLLTGGVMLAYENEMPYYGAPMAVIHTVAEETHVEWEPDLPTHFRITSIQQEENGNIVTARFSRQDNGNRITAWFTR